MKKCKFANGYVGILNNNIAAILEKKGEVRILGDAGEQKPVEAKPAEGKGK